MKMSKEQERIDAAKRSNQFQSTDDDDINLAIKMSMQENQI